MWIVVAFWSVVCLLVGLICYAEQREINARKQVLEEIRQRLKCDCLVQKEPGDHHPAISELRAFRDKLNEFTHAYDELLVSCPWLHVHVVRFKKRPRMEFAAKTATLSLPLSLSAVQILEWRMAVQTMQQKLASVPVRGSLHCSARGNLQAISTLAESAVRELVHCATLQQEPHDDVFFKFSIRSDDECI